MIRHWFSDPGCHIGRRNPDWRISLKFDVTVCSGVSSVRHQHWVSMHVVNDLETTKPKSRSTSMAALRKPTEETDQIPNSDSENSFQFRRLSANFGLKLSAGWLRFDDSDTELSLSKWLQYKTSGQKFPTATDLRMPIYQFSFDFIESTDWKIEIVPCRGCRVVSIQRISRDQGKNKREGDRKSCYIMSV